MDVKGMAWAGCWSPSASVDRASLAHRANGRRDRHSSNPAGQSGQKSFQLQTAGGPEPRRNGPQGSSGPGAWSEGGAYTEPWGVDHRSGKWEAAGSRRRASVA